MLLPVIMAGGVGSRLWPLSRELYPKQFLTLNGCESMLHQTFSRLDNMVHEPPLLICNEEHRFLAAEQIRSGGFKNSGIILEPVGRNTAPAIALAALHAILIGESKDPILLVLAADHVIKDKENFQKVVKQALPYAESNNLVTFGIIPDRIETAYGYIKRGSSINTTDDSELFKVSSFVEKPDFDTAKKYFESGDYYWNSGIFMFKASVYLDELKKNNLPMYSACKDAIMSAKNDLDFIRISRDLFEKCPSDSIDYAVMEPICEPGGSGNLIVVPMDSGWNDLGSWSALWDISEKDSNNNVHRGDVVSINSLNNYVYSETRLVATVGINDIVIVDTEDALLVSNRDQVQDVKSIVQHLKDCSRKEYKSSRMEYRPWGCYSLLSSGSKNKINRIVINPGKKISIQKHKCRSEHWIVSYGSALVYSDGNKLVIEEGESIYIPIGAAHSVENVNDFPIEIIEVQTGQYIGEDDVERLSDL